MIDWYIYPLSIIPTLLDDNYERTGAPVSVHAQLYNNRLLASKQTKKIQNVFKKLNNTHRACEIQHSSGAL